MKIWFKLLLGIILGVVVGFLVPINNEFWNVLINNFSKFGLNILLYFTIVYVIIKVFNSIISLKTTKVKVWKLTLIFILFSFVSMLISSILTMLIVNITGGQFDVSFDLMQKKSIKININSFSDIFENVFTNNIINILNTQNVYILSLLFLSIIFAYGAFFSGKDGKNILDITKSLGNIFDNIVLQIIEFFSFISFFLVAKFVIESRVGLVDYLNLLLRPIVNLIIVSVLILILFGILLKIIFKEKIGDFFIGVLGPALISLITGNNVSSLIALNLHSKKNLNIDDDISDFLTPISYVVNQTGTFIVTIIILFNIQLTINQALIPFKIQVFVLLLMFLFLIRLDGINELSVLALLIMILKEPTLHYEENLYLIYIGLIPLFSRFANFINVWSSGILMLLTSKYFGSHKHIESKDFI